RRRRHRHHARRGRGGPAVEAGLGHLRPGLDWRHAGGQWPDSQGDRAGQPGGADQGADRARGRAATPAGQHHRAHGRRGIVARGQVRHAERAALGVGGDHRHPARRRVADRHAPVGPRRRRGRPRRLPGGRLLGDAGAAEGGWGLGHPGPGGRGDEVLTRTGWRTLAGAAPRRVAIAEKAAAEARADLPPAAARALRVAADNVRVFHAATRPEDTAFIETTPGVKSKLVWRPIGSAGLYVPGGTAPLFSSLLMLAIPAGGAGVGRRVAVTPPSKDGSVHPAMIVAAAEAGLDELWLLGGAQAIAALTFGVELDEGVIAPVDKLFGPGNAYVAEAKRYASSLPG